MIRKRDDRKHVGKFVYVNGYEVRDEAAANVLATCRRHGYTLDGGNALMPRASQAQLITIIGHLQRLLERRSLHDQTTRDL